MRIARLLPPKPGGAYERALKKLAKDYPQVASDAQSVLAQFVGPNAFPVPCPPKAFQLPAVSREVLKIRVGSSDQNKGKSGGFRLLLANKGNDAWQPLVIYAKAQTEDLPRPRVLELIEEELSDEPDPSSEPTAAESPADPKPVPLPAARPLLPSPLVPALTLDQLAAHLAELGQLAPGWGGEQEEPPSARAVSLARRVAQAFAEASLCPDRLVADVNGGITFHLFAPAPERPPRSRASLTADNDGDLVAVLSPVLGRIEVTTVPLDELPAAVDRLRRFIGR